MQTYVIIEYLHNECSTLCSALNAKHLQHNSCNLKSWQSSFFNQKKIKT